MAGSRGISSERATGSGKPILKTTTEGKTMKTRVLIGALAALILAAGPALASDKLASSMDEAIAMSQETGLPVLLDIGTSW